MVYVILIDTITSFQGIIESEFPKVNYDKILDLEELKVIMERLKVPHTKLGKN